MKHHDKIRKLGRTSNQRRALLRGLAVSLIRDGKIRTTEAKAKELRPFIEKLVTLGRRDTISSRRLVSARLGGVNVAANRLAKDIAPRYKDRSGGYTRITKLPSRISDGGNMATIEFV